VLRIAIAVSVATSDTVFTSPKDSPCWLASCLSGRSIASRVAAPAHALRSPTSPLAALCASSGCVIAQMDTDAYSSFVTVDVEAISALFRLGIIGGTQYGDIADDVLSPPARYFRQSLECLKRAVEYFRSKNVTVIAHLGDALAAENADSGSQWTALQSFNNVRSKLPGAAWHVAPGSCDARCFGADGIGPALSSGRSPSERTYYSFFPAAQWRVLVLDTTDPTGGFSPASASPGVPDGVLTGIGGSGSLGPAQVGAVPTSTHARARRAVPAVPAVTCCSPPCLPSRAVLLRACTRVPCVPPRSDAPWFGLATAAS
jgi:hypothetical protein